MHPDTIYTIALPTPQRHFATLTMELTGLDAAEIELQMPVWTPGSYMVREYSRHVRGLRAEAAGQALSVTKVAKNRWRIATNGAAAVTVTYELYGFELTVRTNHIDASHAHFTPAATFLYLVGREEAGAQVRIEAPKGWQIATGLEPVAGATTPTFAAKNLDELMDTPIEVGEHQRYEFTVGGKQHALVIWGRGNGDPEQLVADTQQIVETEMAFWGGELPYEHYTFILHLGGPDAGGGLEHHNSTVLLLPRTIFKPRKSYERFLSLTAHEFFHTWNVKRLRPETLGPFDYGAENYTRLLWVMEGFTEYYTDLMLVRAGLMTPERYLERLAQDIVTLQTTPGRLYHSVSNSSYDAWIKLYRPDESTPNTTISYYLKGALVALLLDMELRSRSEGAVSLDTLIRDLYARYPITGPGIPEDGGMRAAIEALVPGDWEPFFARYIDGVEELPFDEALATVGVALNWSHKHTNEDGQPRVSLGARTADGKAGGVRLSHVIEGGAAEAAGLSAGDELIAIDGWRIDPKNLDDRLADYSAGASVEVAFFRSDVLMRLPLTLAAPAHDALKLVPRADASAEQQAQYRSWLGLAG